MSKRTKQRHSRLMTISIGLATAFVANLGHATSDIGPLPPLKFDEAKAELGKRLFFDARLSGDAAISCATCHDPEHGFSTSKALSDGYPGNKHFRNAPTMINTAYKKVWMHDGRIGTNLNDVTREMITEDYIFNMDMRIMQERLKQDSKYLEMFEAAGYGEPSNGKVRNAIPEYLKTLTSRGAPFDTGEMSEAAQRGMAIFKGKGNCMACHNTPLFSDGQSHNTGVPENFDIFRDSLRHQAFIAYNMFLGNENYMALMRDPGTHVQTHKADGSDMGKFMTPTLRELKYTQPYMHNGMLKTLEDVVEFYNNGGGEDRNKATLIKPLNLTEEEKQDLVAFLLALSGEPLTTSEHVWTSEFPNEYEAIEDWRNVPN
ncbi:MAG: photosynthetic protein synthase I [Candidatus Parabeggiatoa sp. nov. 3]|nr:MAG: photosynthetic protein synthase I [Gammaproteobacteria bacterium]RKZ55787.1 MAG: photosynthetic protein synthase I [Gammaproteobacteria bacterium]RKZ77468.1 MAG: photosynthetic protein synthase I [Gammaproteobacteria bacterium]